MREGASKQVVSKRPLRFIYGCLSLVVVSYLLTPVFSETGWEVTEAWSREARILLLLFFLSVLSYAAAKLLSSLRLDRCVVLGTSDDAYRVAQLARKVSHPKIQLVGFVCSNGESESATARLAGYPMLGKAESVARVVALHSIDSLVVTPSAKADRLMHQRVRSLRYRGLAVIDYALLYEELTGSISLEDVDAEWLFRASMNNSRFHFRWMKRGLDLVCATLGLIATLPLLAFAAVLIKLDSRGPVLYRQDRLGRDGTPFTVLKLRTMYADAEQQTGPVWAAADDPRVTRLGKWLRKFRVDEILQLVNVLRGEMSLVGPRPEREVFVTWLAEKIPFYRERLMVLPGITGWAQVSQPYAASVEATRRKLQYDLYYMKHASLLTDLHILLQTVKIVFLGREREQSAPGRCVRVEEATPQDNSNGNGAAGTELAT